jgi:HEPN domain-containing protein
MDLAVSFERLFKRAQDDIELAEVTLERGKWLYVGFFCQQAIEKIAKGIHLLLLNKEAPKIHKINEIILLFEALLPEPVTDERRILFTDLSKFYIDSRYPDLETDLEFEVMENEARNLLAQSREAYEWFLKLATTQLNPTPTDQSTPSPKL